MREAKTISIVPFFAAPKVAVEPALSSVPYDLAWSSMFSFVWFRVSGRRGISPLMLLYYNAGGG